MFVFWKMGKLNEWKKRNKLFLVIGLLGLGLSYLMIFQRAKESVAFKRGDILSKEGVELACSGVQYTIAIDPTVIKSPEQMNAILLYVIALRPDLTLKQITEKIWGERSYGGRYRVLAKRLLQDPRKDPNYPNIYGLIVTKKYHRVYPYANLFSHVLGFLLEDEKNPAAGVEYSLNKRLSGKDLLSEKKLHSPQNLNLSLGIKEQKAFHDLLANLKEQCGAASVWGVLCRSNGEVAAMCSFPDYDPNYYNNTPLTARVNRTICTLTLCGGSSGWPFPESLDKNQLGVLKKTGIELSGEFRGTEKEEGVTVSAVQIARGWLQVLSGEKNLTLRPRKKASGFRPETFSKNKSKEVDCCMMSLKWNPDIFDSSDLGENLLRPNHKTCQTIVWVNYKKQLVGVVQLDAPKKTVIDFPSGFFDETLSVHAQEDRLTHDGNDCIKE